MEIQNYTNLTKEIKDKYKQLKQLLKEEWINEEVFTDKFLELLVEISDKLSFLLWEKSETTKARKEESLEKLYQRTIDQAINRIIEIQDTPEIELDNSLLWIVSLKKRRN